MEDAVDHEAGRARALAALDEARARAGRPARRARPSTVDLRAMPEPEPAPTDEQAAARIADLEAEVARLRRLLAEIRDRTTDALTD